MQLKRIHILNYKNVAEAQLAFSPNVNCFVGANGMGKTNVLDSIYYLSFAKSANNANDAFNILHEADFLLLEGEYLDDSGVEENVTCGLQRGQRKRLKRNGKDYKRISEHVGAIPLVMISPSDSALISGGSEERRKFLNAVISQYDSAYLEAVMRYERTLKQRNALLKQEAEPDGGVMSVLEDLMDADSQIIFHKRVAFVEEFVPIFQSLYRRLCSNETEEVDVVYQSHNQRGSLAEQLLRDRAKERVVGYTLHGSHKDELDFLLNGYSVKREASQGQTKTYFIALKLAQFLFLKGKGERRVPLLLLDDIFDKLDAHRVARIVEYVSGDVFGQIFITDTNREHLDQILAATTKEYKLFQVEGGVITEK